METFINYQFTWGQFLFLIICLLLSYVVLYFFKELLVRTPFPRYVKQSGQGLVHNLLVIYEPLACIIIMIAFVFIKPLFHGLLVLLLLLVSFTYLKTYMSGRLILLNQHIIEGTLLKVNQVEGIVSNMGRMGLDLQTNEGLHRLNYTNVLNAGYTLIASDEIGGFYQLRVSPQTDSRKRHALYLADLLATTPYIDWGHKPDIIVSDEDDEQLEIRVLIKEESHLHDLIALIKEWGYNCQLMN